MKTIILFAMMASVVCLSCTHKRQQTQPEAAPDKVFADSLSDAEEEKLSTMLEELRKRLDATTDTALRINAFGNGRESRTIRVSKHPNGKNASASILWTPRYCGLMVLTDKSHAN